jgi:pseudaminic acid cytidylyltransferase
MTKDTVKKIAVIPARGGSKRIPRKNIKNFHGKPLIAYSIETALASNLFDRIIVSTDDMEIADIAKHYGAAVPFMRPKELADDYSGTTDVEKHALLYYKEQGEEFDYVCLIYPTAPFLREEYLRESYEKLRLSKDAVYSFSSTSMPYPFQRSFKLRNDGRCEMFFPEYYESRSQDLEESYHDAGQFYWTDLSRIEDREGLVIFSDVSIPIILPRHLVVDIDTPEDWDLAEKLFAVQQSGI